MATGKKSLELWDGFTVELNQQLMDDFDFSSDLSDAYNANDLRTVGTMYMALIGGEEVYEQVREHITEEHGYFSTKAFSEVLKKIDNALPKSGNRAQRRSWKASA